MLKSKSRSKRRDRSLSDDSKTKRSKATSKSSDREKIRKNPGESKSRRAKSPFKSAEKNEIRKKPDDSKSKRAKAHSNSAEKDKVRENSDASTTKCRSVHPKPDEMEKIKENTKSVPRRTRWQAEDNKDSPKNVPIPEPAARQEKSGSSHRIVRESLHDKEKLVELLFQLVTGTALQELIPDYLKERSNDELKKLCLEQLKLMSDETILQIISRQSPKGKEKQDVVQESEKKPEDSKTDATNKLSEDATQPQATTSDEMDIAFEQNIPVVIKEKVAKDLLQPNRDAELLELEMRARAIRSLLKVKKQSPSKEETSSPKEDK